MKPVVPAKATAEQKNCILIRECFHACPCGYSISVPIVLGYLDYGRKQVGTGGAFYPGNDIEADFNQIRQFYKNRRGETPENESPIEVRQKKG